jgi:hypothetical protein
LSLELDVATVVVALCELRARVEEEPCASLRGFIFIAEALVRAALIAAGWPL